MTAVNRPLNIEQGATWTLGFTWCRESDPPTVPPTPGVAYDLTDAVVRMQIRTTHGSPVLVDASTVGVDPMITIGDPPTGGRIDIRFPATITDQMVEMPDPLGRYSGHSLALYDLEVELPNGDVHRILQGQVTVSANITRVS